MNIQSAIRDYIYSHDFVMLPGIGAFVAEYSKPYFDLNGEIVPSERKLRFNPHLRNDSDVEILQAFREKMNISDQEVQEQYFAFLDSVNSEIAAFNRYYWEDFGIILREGPDQAFQFLPFQPSVSEPARHVSSGDMTSGSKDTTPEETFVFKEREEVFEPVGITEDAPAPGTGGEEDGDEDEPEERREGNKALKYLIFALPLGLLIAALGYMVFLKPSLRENVKEKTVLKETDFSPEEVTVDTLYSEETPPLPPGEEPASEEHVVRIGIYKRSIDADKIAAFLATKGYTAQIRPYGPLFMVYLVAETEDQALRYIREVEPLINDTPIYERKKRNG
ncbi:MAG: hypothetical protein LRY55_01265 [Leadbetterella sp.]|nr:hypothetical protein [Leadbetterella sp.]